MVWVETPSNPLLNVVDIRKAAARGARGRRDCSSSTTPSRRRTSSSRSSSAPTPSSTRRRSTSAATATSSAASSRRTTTRSASGCFFLQKSLGAVPGPFDAWLVLRGIKTLAVRMRQHCENARAIADFLDGHDAVERVLYPGLPSHPSHEVARAQMRDFGGMVSFLAETEDEAVELVARTKLFALAESLGGVESLIEHPARMTHASTAGAPFAPPANLVRLSVGIESVDDLIADLEAALVRRAPARASRSASGRSTSGMRRRPDRPACFGSALRSARDRRLPRRDRRRACALRLRPDVDAAGARGGPRRARRSRSSDIRHLLLSHIHLDHAGAAGPIVRDHPHLTVWVSEIGAPHLVDPSRLERSARRLYGELFDPLWGELAPVPEANVRIADGDVLGWEAFPTQGHASHHVSYLRDGTLLAGDAAGVRMPGAVVRPARLAAARRRRRGVARDRRRDPGARRPSGSR